MPADLGLKGPRQVPAAATAKSRRGNHHMTRQRLLMGAALATIAAMTATAAAAQDAVREDRAPAPYVGPAEQTAQPPMQPIPNCPVPSGPCLTASTRWNGAVETREEDRRADDADGGAA